MVTAPYRGLLDSGGLGITSQERMQDRVMYALLMDFRALTGAGPRGAKHTLPQAGAPGPTPGGEMTEVHYPWRLPLQQAV